MNFDERYNELLMRDKTNDRDIERKGLFYILAGNDDLFNKVNHLYDFEEHSIKPECLEGGLLSLVETSLVTLAFSHYNGFPCDTQDLLYPLDDDNFNLAINSMKLRYRKG